MYSNTVFTTHFKIAGRSARSDFQGGGGEINTGNSKIGLPVSNFFYNLCLKTMFFYVVSPKFQINLPKITDQ